MQEIERLYLQYSGDVYRYLLHLTGSQMLAEDLLSETFLTALRCLGTFRGESTVKTWLIGIARNKWYEHLKKKYKTVTEELQVAEYLTSGETPETEFIRRGWAHRAMELLGTMPEKQRQIFLLRTEGFTYDEISQQLGVSASSARVTDFRVKQKLKSVLEEEGYP